MPNYTFRNKKTKREVDLSMSMAEREEYLAKHTEMEQIIKGMAIGDPIKLGIRQPSSDMNQILQKVKDHHPRSTVRTGNISEL